LKKILFFLLLIAASTVKSQNTGFMGKHFLLKAETIYLITGSYDFSAEYAFNRNWSATLNYSSQRVEPSAASISQSTAETSEFKVGLRHYLTPEQAAPSGGYHYLNLGLGNATMSGKTLNSSITEDDLLIYSNETIYTVNNIPLYRGEIGIGYQQIYFGVLALDISIGVGFGYLNSEYYDEYELHRAYRNIGNQWQWQSDYRSKFNYGMRFLFQAGLLIY
jgi:hypothetical protein